jgi:hypothetical protein
VRRDRENTSEFIAKKREMFLVTAISRLCTRAVLFLTHTLQVQMSLDTKRAEIRKLEEQAQQREDALKRSEGMLEEDAMRFDAFLKENDYKAVEAIRKAEQETKAKQVPAARLNPISAEFLSPPPPAAPPHPRPQERIAEIKRISSQIASVKSDMGRFEEQLEDCRRYRDFLYKLSPEEWRQEQAARIAQIRANRRAARAAGGRVHSRAALLCAAHAAAASATPSSASGGSRASATHSPAHFPALFVTAPAGTTADAKAAAGAEPAAAVDEDAFDWDEDPAMCDAATPSTRYRIIVVTCSQTQVLHVASAAARHIQRAGGEELVPHSEQPRDGGSA